MVFIFICLAIGFLAGILGGLFGIGGGVVMVPAIMLLFNAPQLTAQGTSLFALLAPVSLLAVWEYHQKGNVDFIKGAWIIGGLILGTFIGAQFAHSLSPAILKKLLAGFYIACAIYVILK